MQTSVEKTTSPKRLFYRIRTGIINKERLIEMVKNSPCLWDPFHSAYKNPEDTERAWSEIAETLNFTDGKHAKSTWKTLKDIFRESLLRRIELKKLNRSCKKWRFTRQMSFIVPHMCTRGQNYLESIQELLEEDSREAVTEINEVPEVTQVSNEAQEPLIIQNSILNKQDQKMIHIPVVLQLSKLIQNSEMVQNSIKLPHNSDKDCQNSEAGQKTNIMRISENFHNSSEVMQSSHMIQSSELTQSPEENLPQTPDCVENGNDSKDSSFSQRKRRKTTDSSSCLLSNDKESKGLNCGIVKSDALLNFFTSMYNTTSQFPPLMQLQVKKKVFEVVIQAEESSLLYAQDHF